MNTYVNLEEVYAYIAGIMDLKGIFEIRKRKRGDYYYYTAEIGLQLTKKPIINFILLYFSCSHHLRIDNREPRNRQPIHFLRINSKDRIKFLEGILPHLIIKRKQAKLCLDLQKNIEINLGGNIHEIAPYRDRLFFECKESNQK